MSRPHFDKPFPIGFYDNAKIHKQHFFLFDVLCRHLDQDEDSWIRTDSKTLARLLKQTSGITVQTPKKILTTLQDHGYIEMPPDPPSRSWQERVNGISFLKVLILDSAWEEKGIVRTYSLDRRHEYMRERYERRKALLASEDLES